MPFKKVSDDTYCFEEFGAAVVEATQSMKDDFTRHGYLIIKQILSTEEVAKVHDAVAGAEQLWKATLLRRDNTGREDSGTHQGLYHEPGNDILGKVTGNVKTAGIAEQLLGRGELYLYHGKAMTKKPFSGGSVEWHQDYGYWYYNRMPFPDAISCILALTKSDHENGGLQVIPGSQFCSRIEHGMVDGQQMTSKHNRSSFQACADLDRVQLIAQSLSVKGADLSAGDCLMLHSNTLHRSGINESEHKRWNLIFSYCTKGNSPDRPHHHALYGEYPLIRFDADAIKKCAELTLQNRAYGQLKVPRGA